MEMGLACRHLSPMAVDMGTDLAAHAHEAMVNGSYTGQLLQRMSDMELEGYSSAGPASNCSTLHTILRSPLSDGKESVLVVTPVALSQGAAGCREHPTCNVLYAHLLCIYT